MGRMDSDEVDLRRHGCDHHDYNWHGINGLEMT